MPLKCIYMHIYEEFTIQSHIQAYRGNANVYGPLWTLICICAVWTYFLIILYIFPLLFFPKKTLSLPISSTIAWQTVPIITASCMTSPPYILLFASHSPVICKDYFPLVYMYKSSRYYLVSNHQFGFYIPSVNLSLSLDTSSTAAIKHFGYYCQWLPGLTTKFIYYYLYSHHFRTRFTFTTEGMLPLMVSFQFVPLDPLAPRCTFRLTLLHKQLATQQLSKCPHSYASIT